MPTLHSLRYQHDEASRMMLRLINLIEARGPADDVYPIALQLARWVSLLRSHLASEDQWLYPALVALGGSRAAMVARAFKTEMGHLAQQLEAFDRRWSSSAVIAADFDRFRHEAFALFADFDRRIEREDSVLYPIAESSGIGAMSKAA